MKKFKCNACYNHCVLTTKDNNGSLVCHFGRQDWYEVKEEERPAKQEKALPDWCKVGTPVYNIEKKQYQTISFINGTVICNNIDGDGCTQYGYGAFINDCVKACTRPFNADEMKALVGKILVNKKTKDVNLVTDYINEVDEDDADYHYCTVYVGGENLVAEDLLEYYTINGNPCYVLEHLENGEWVE